VRVWREKMITTPIPETSATHRVIRVRHGIERAKLEGELVDDEVVGFIFGPYNPSKPFLVLRANPQNVSKLDLKMSKHLLDIV
jgi:hypothetical protein